MIRPCLRRACVCLFLSIVTCVAASIVSAQTSSGTTSGTYTTTTPTTTIVGYTSVQNIAPAIDNSNGSSGDCCASQGMVASGVQDNGHSNSVCTSTVAIVDGRAMTTPRPCSTCGGGGGGGADLSRPDAGGGCSSCGGAIPSAGTSVDGATDFEPGRAFRPDDRAIASSFGPGMFSVYDSRVYLYPVSSGGTNAVYYDAMQGRSVSLADGQNGDPLDGKASAH